MSIKRFFAVICMIVLCCTFVSTAFADSYKGSGTYTESFTVATGNRNATLTITPKQGKVTGTAWKNPFRGTTKQVTQKAYADYSVTVTTIGGGSTTKTMSSGKVTFSLAKNTMYKVTVSYRGINFFSTCYIWNTSWKSDPSWKASVNGWAQIR